MRCIYCQNHDISRNACGNKHQDESLPGLLDRIESILERGINTVGFVSPSHFVPQVKAIIEGLNSRGLKPVTVYNTSGYDKAETLRSISDLIDIYLPDYKYVTPSLAREYSDAYDYPEIALKALREMYYQKGSVLRIDASGRAEYGMLIRHLVLPGHVDESIKVLKTIADELSTGIHISLMSQYNPPYPVRDHPVLNRTLLRSEYEAVAGAMEKLGFRNGWVQEMESFQNYMPDFSKENPF